MAKGSLWAGIAAAANGIGGVLQQREADERKQKLYMMEQDILQKRQEALASLRGDIQDTNAANRSNRALGRLDYKHALESGDIVGQFRDEETGDMYGRRKDGSVVPLDITSDEYQDVNKRIRAGKAAEADLAPEKTSAQIAQTRASTANLQSITADRDAKPATDPAGQPIRKDYMTQMRDLQKEEDRKAAAAQKAGETYTPTDPLKLQQEVLENLHYTYGADAVNGALGKAPVPGQPRATMSDRAPGVPAPIANRAAAPNHTPADVNASLQADGGLAKTAQPGVPSPAELLSKFNTASAQVGDNPQKQAALQKRLNDLMQQYGYTDLLNQQQQ